MVPLQPVSEYFMRRRTSEDSQASFHHQAHAARANSASPRPSTKSAAHASESSAKSGVEGQWHSSARSAFRMKPSFGTGTDLSPVPVAPTGRVACDADERLDASTSLCSVSRISIRFTVRIGYLAVQRVHSRRAGSRRIANICRLFSRRSSCM